MKNNNQGQIQGAAHPARTPLNWKNMIFHTKYPKNFRQKSINQSKFISDNRVYLKTNVCQIYFFRRGEVWSHNGYY
jgi:hypothetical protein